MTTKLYRGSTNNGVHTVLTEDAVNAYKSLIRRGPVGTNDDLWTRIAHGTFAFVSETLGVEYFHARITPGPIGCLEELDKWAPALEACPVENYVPFSNGAWENDSQFGQTRERVNAAFDIDVTKARRPSAK